MSQSGKYYRFVEYSVLKDYPAPDSSNATTKFTNRYDTMKTLPLHGPCRTWRVKDSSNSNPYVAFVGGGIHEFVPSLADANATKKLSQLVVPATLEVLVLSDFPCHRPRTGSESLEKAPGLLC